MNLEDLHSFWFGAIEITPAYYRLRVPQWFFGQDVEFDRQCAARFGTWPDRIDASYDLDARPLLTKIILFDQIPRNAFRDHAKAHDFDPLARALSLHAIRSGKELELSFPERLFLYLPLQHAEEMDLQDMSVEAFAKLDQDAPAEIHPWTGLALLKAQSHRDTIRRFGRFPQRNQKLGRTNTREEEIFLLGPSGSSELQTK